MNNKSWHIEKVKLSELRGFIETKKFSSDSFVPVSSMRVESYLANPNAQPSDIVLYYIEIDNKVIAFRTIWADVLRADQGEIRFGWCSGNWVHPNWRRKGFSALLLSEAYADWGQRLMFTNYAPESLQGYLKSGLFHEAISRVGKRFYLNADYKKLLLVKTKQVPAKYFLKIAAKAVGFYARLSAASFSPVNFREFEIHENNTYHESFFDTLDEKITLFKRSNKGYRWVFQYPWIKKTVSNENYPFSLYNSNFDYYFISLSKKGEKIASMLLSDNRGYIKLLYANANGHYRAVLMCYLAKWCAVRAASTLTVCDSDYAGIMHSVKNPFIWNKAFSMHVYSTFDLGTGANKLQVYDGDGDYIFT